MINEIGLCVCVSCHGLFKALSRNFVEGLSEICTLYFRDMYLICISVSIVLVTIKTVFGTRLIVEERVLNVP